MKKTILLLATITALIACSKKSDTTVQDPIESKIIGSWKIDTSFELSYVNGILDTDRSDTTVGQIGDYFNFTIDKLLHVLMTKDEGRKEGGTYVYSYSNNIVFIKSPDNSAIAFDIKELSDKYFVLENKTGDEKNYDLMIFKLKNKTQL